MKVKMRKTDVWIPDWNGNLSEPEDEQIRFHHRFLSAAERKQYIYTRPIKLKTGQDDQGTEMEYVQDGKGIAMKVTSKVENLAGEYDDGSEFRVSTIQELYASPFSDLVAMYEGYLLGASAVVDPKN